MREKEREKLKLLLCPLEPSGSSLLSAAAPYPVVVYNPDSPDNQQQHQQEQQEKQKQKQKEVIEVLKTMGSNHPTSDISHTRCSSQPCAVYTSTSRPPPPPPHSIQPETETETHGDIERQPRPSSLPQGRGGGALKGQEEEQQTRPTSGGGGVEGGQVQVGITVLPTAHHLAPNNIDTNIDINATRVGGIREVGSEPSQPQQHQESQQEPESEPEPEPWVQVSIQSISEPKHSLDNPWNDAQNNIPLDTPLDGPVVGEVDSSPGIDRSGDSGAVSLSTPSPTDRTPRDREKEKEKMSEREKYNMIDEENNYKKTKKISSKNDSFSDYYYYQHADALRYSPTPPRRSIDVPIPPLSAGKADGKREKKSKSEKFRTKNVSGWKKVKAHFLTKSDDYHYTAPSYSGHSPIPPTSDESSTTSGSTDSAALEDESHGKEPELKKKKKKKRGLNVFETLQLPLVMTYVALIILDNP